jgi:uncharacterized protein
MLLTKLRKGGFINPPAFIDETHTAFLAMVGSTAYGVAQPDSSDIDVAGFVVPPKEDTFPSKELVGFGKPHERFQVWTEHHIKANRKEYDMAVFSIVKFFNLALKNAPNALDILFVPDNCVLHSTKVGQMVREKRRLFLHKGAWHTLKGFAYNNFHRYKQTDPAAAANEKRAATIEAHGYDTKSMSQVVRCLDFAEQILTEHDLDLQRNREQIKSVRRGEWTLERVQDFFEEREKSLGQVYLDSTLQHGPDEAAIRQLLLDCLEEQYGDLGGTTAQRDTSIDEVLTDMRRV